MQLDCVPILIPVASVLLRKRSSDLLAGTILLMFDEPSARRFAFI
jgi:hypothetical protein